MIKIDIKSPLKYCNVQFNPSKLLQSESVKGSFTFLGDYYVNSLLTLCNENFYFRLINGINSAHLDLLRLASAAAACRS